METEWKEISHPIDRNIPKMPFLSEPEFRVIEDASLRATEIRIVTHVGTHLEAPIHLFDDGASIDEYPLERWITDGVVATVDAEPRQEITLEDLNVPREPDKGDALLVRTGWEERVGDDSYFEQPYLSEDVATWIADRELSWIGVDSPSPEMPNSIRERDPFPFPVHSTLLENDVLIAEHLTNLSSIAGRAVEVIALPLPYVDSDAAHARIAARPK
jgi:kynurenine formamidase